MQPEQSHSVNQETLAKNKEEMFRILHSCIKMGVYADEDPSQWKSFFDFYISFLKSEVGPRGECVKIVRHSLMQETEKYNKILAPFGQDITTPIQEIYMLHNNSSPCDEYDSLLKAKEGKSKAEESLSRLKDENSIMRAKMKEGLLAKHGPDYDYLKEVQQQTQAYLTKINSQSTQISKLQEYLDNCEAYHQYMAVKEQLNPYFKLWKDADSGVGKESNSNGTVFEEKVQRELLPYIIQREQTREGSSLFGKQVKVYINARWIPKDLGQIDIALGYWSKENSKVMITVLIQCKSRLFDLRAAHKQVSLEDNPGEFAITFAELKRIKNQKKEEAKMKRLRKEQGENHDIEEEPSAIKGIAPKEVNRQFKKKTLSTCDGEAQVIVNHEYYLVTTLPQNQFQLPVESTAKEVIEKYTRNKTVGNIESQELRKVLCDKFSKVLSPFGWTTEYQRQFKHPYDSNLIVLS